MRILDENKIKYALQFSLRTRDLTATEADIMILGLINISKSSLIDTTHIKKMALEPSRFLSANQKYKSQA